MRSLIVKKGLRKTATKAISSLISARNRNNDQASLASLVSNKLPPPAGAMGIPRAAIALPYIVRGDQVRVKTKISPG